MRQWLVVAGVAALLSGCVTSKGGRGVKTPGEPPTRADVEACTLRIEGGGKNLIVTRSYDAQGRRTQQISSSTGRDDVPDAEIIDYLYDDDGRLVRETTREMPSRTVRRETTYKYDSWGRLVREEIVDAARPGATIVNEQQFDEFGSLTGRWSYGPAPEGGSHLQEIIGYVWDGGRVMEERHRDPAGGVFHRVLYTYNGDGMRLSREDRFIGEAGERTTRRARYVWDGAGRLVEEELQVLEPDGQQPARSQRAQYEYDATSRRLRERLDLNADGSFDQTVDYDYACMAPAPTADVVVGGADPAKDPAQTLDALVPPSTEEPAKKPAAAKAPPAKKPAEAKPAPAPAPKKEEVQASDAAMRAAGLIAEEPKAAPTPATPAAQPPKKAEEEVDTSSIWEEDEEEAAPAKKPAKKPAPAEPEPKSEGGWED